MVGLLAGSDNVDRAVITGLRNFIRDMGGAIGITGELSSLKFRVNCFFPANKNVVSGAILNNHLHAGLKGHFGPEMISHIASSALNLSELNLSAEEKSLVLDVYMRGMNAVFVSYGVLTVALFLATLCLRDYGLVRKAEQQESDVE